MAQSEERGGQFPPPSLPPLLFLGLALSVEVYPSNPETEDDRGWGLITP